jgi:hypothetical protein
MHATKMTWFLVFDLKYSKEMKIDSEITIELTDWYMELIILSYFCALKYVYTKIF